MDQQRLELDRDPMSYYYYYYYYVFFVKISLHAINSTKLRDDYSSSQLPFPVKHNSILPFF